VGGVAAPAEVAGIPAVEALLEVGEKLGVIERAPAAGDGVAEEVEVDPSLGCTGFGDELFVADLAVLVPRREGRVVRGGGAGCDCSHCGEADPEAWRHCVHDGDDEWK